MSGSTLRLVAFALRVPVATFAILLCLGWVLAGPAHGGCCGSPWISWTLPAADGSFEIVVQDDEESKRSVRVDFVLPPSSPEPSASTAAQIGAVNHRPAIILLHGVEGAAKGRLLHLLQARRLAAAGYAVFLVHYFDGLAYSDLLLYGEREQLDVEAIRAVAVQDHHLWLRAVTQSLTAIAKRPGIDRARLALVGYSLGSFVGLAATAEAAAQPEIPDVAAMVGNWGARFETTQFAKTFPPTLLLHGEQDEVVPVSEARNTAAAMIAAGVADVRLKTYSGQPHAILTGPAADNAQHATLTFLQFHLGR